MELTKNDKRVITISAILIFAGIVTWLFFFIKNSVQNAKKNALLNSATSSGEVVIDLGGKAAEIYDALHGSWLSEDEDRAIQAIISVPKNSIHKLETIYFSLYGYNLKQDLINYLSNSEFKRISYQFS